MKTSCTQCWLNKRLCFMNVQCMRVCLCKCLLCFAYDLLKLHFVCVFVYCFCWYAIKLFIFLCIPFVLFHLIGLWNFDDSGRGIRFDYFLSSEQWKGFVGGGWSSYFCLFSVFRQGYCAWATVMLVFMPLIFYSFFRPAPNLSSILGSSGF